MNEVQVFQKYVKCQGKGHDVKHFGLVTRNMKALVLYVSVQQLWPRLNFLKQTMDVISHASQSLHTLPIEFTGLQDRVVHRLLGPRQERPPFKGRGLVQVLNLYRV